MDKISTQRLMVIWLFSTLLLGVQSCEDRSASLEKSKVQFSLNPGTTSNGRVKDSDLPDNVRLRISIASPSGTPIFTDHEIQVSRGGEGYMADPLDLLPGNYVVTDFMIVNDSEVLNAAPKSESPFSALVMNSLPYSFSVTENSVSRVGMQVINVRGEKPEAFGYDSFRVNRANSLSFIVFRPNGGQASSREATAELRQGKLLIKKFAVKAGMNTLVFDGQPDAVYTLSVYGRESAKAKTFNFKELKKQLGAKPLKIQLEPALLLTMESYVDEGNDYDDYYHFLLEGTGTVNINWGDGYEESQNLPFDGEHEYTMGNYTAIVTGDLDQIINFHGFSYSTIMEAITGLTNLTALKTFNPSWGAVPVKVNLSNCENLEAIHIEKYGGPYYETLDLRTDFQLPEEHFIREFYLYINETVGTGALEAFVDNIYNNTTQRSIYGGTFYVNVSEPPSSETQQKLDILQNDYNWDVTLEESVWDISGDGSEPARARQDLDARRENWLRHNFPDSKLISRSVKKMVRMN